MTYICEECGTGEKGAAKIMLRLLTWQHPFCSLPCAVKWACERKIACIGCMVRNPKNAEIWIFGRSGVTFSAFLACSERCASSALKAAKSYSARDKSEEGRWIEKRFPIVAGGGEKLHRFDPIALESMISEFPDFSNCSKIKEAEKVTKWPGPRGAGNDSI